VRHLSDGALRRVHDDRFAGSNREREHLDRCDRCRQRARGVAADATFAASTSASASSSGSARCITLNACATPPGDPPWW